MSRVVFPGKRVQIIRHAATGPVNRIVGGNVFVEMLSDVVGTVFQIGPGIILFGLRFAPGIIIAVISGIGAKAAFAKIGFSPVEFIVGAVTAGNYYSKVDGAGGALRFLGSK